MKLATLAEVKAEIKELTTVTADDAFLLRALDHVSARLENMRKCWFQPHYQARKYDAIGEHVRPFELMLDRPLLALSALVNGDNQSITVSDVFLYPANKTPHKRIALTDFGVTTFTFNSDWRQAITVTGHWGYHRDYSGAWYSSGDTVEDAPLSSSSTTITVNDADGANAYGETPRFSPGHLLRIESEYVEVVAVNTTTNALTVLRGVNGTTAASHAQNTVIEVYRVDEAVNRAATKWAAYLYKRRGAFEKAVFDGLTTTTFPADAPEEVLNILAELDERKRIRPV